MTAEITPETDHDYHDSNPYVPLEHGMLLEYHQSPHTMRDPYSKAYPQGVVGRLEIVQGHRGHALRLVGCWHDGEQVPDLDVPSATLLRHPTLNRVLSACGCSHRPGATMYGHYIERDGHVVTTGTAYEVWLWLRAGSLYPNFCPLEPPPKHRSSHASAV